MFEIVVLFICCDQLVLMTDLF